MTVFSTPGPVEITVEIEIGAVRVVAGDRADTVVDVEPSDPSRPSDVKAAEQTLTDCVSGRLQVRTPKQRTAGLFGKPGSVDVTIQAPAGSLLQGSAAAASFRTSGDLGACRVRTSAGDISLEHAGAVELRTGIGAVSVDSADGPADVRTGTGDIRLGSVTGPVNVRNSNGGTSIEQAGGEVRVKAANGDIVVGRAAAGVFASTANGDVRVGEIGAGSTSLRTAVGEIEVGIAEGAAARLDVSTSYGRVRNLLSTIDSPGESSRTLEVHAHSSAGDIVVRRA